MAFMPVVETGDVMSSELGLSRLIELGLLSFAASVLTVAIILQRCPLSLRSRAAFIVLPYGVWALASSLWSTNPVLSFGKGAELILTYFVAVALVVYLKGVVGFGPRHTSSVVALGLLMVLTFLLLCNVLISGGAASNFNRAP